MATIRGLRVRIGTSKTQTEAQSLGVVKVVVMTTSMMRWRTIVIRRAPWSHRMVTSHHKVQVCATQAPRKAITTLSNLARPRGTRKKETKIKNQTSPLTLRKDLTTRQTLRMRSRKKHRKSKILVGAIRTKVSSLMEVV